MIRLKRASWIIALSLIMCMPTLARDEKSSRKKGITQFTINDRVQTVTAFPKETFLDEGEGSIDYLNNDQVVVRIASKVWIKNGEMLFAEGVSFLYGQAKASVSDLIAEESFQGFIQVVDGHVYFDGDYLFGPDKDKGGDVSTRAGGDEHKPKQTCQGACSNGLTCTQECQQNQACISYCNNGTPVCDCVARPSGA